MCVVYILQLEIYLIGKKNYCKISDNVRSTCMHTHTRAYMRKIHIFFFIIFLIKKVKILCAVLFN